MHVAQCALSGPNALKPIYEEGENYLTVSNALKPIYEGGR
jgi:hypothetical protein